MLVIQERATRWGWPVIACGSGSLHRALETGGTPRWDRAGGCDLARSDLLPASSSSKLPSPRCFMGIDVLDFSKPIVLIGTCASSIFPPPLHVESFRLINYFFPPIVVVLPVVVVPIRLSRCLTRVLFASRWISEILTPRDRSGSIQCATILEPPFQRMGVN